MALKTLLIVFAIALTGYSAEISSSYALLKEHTHFQPELKTEPVDQTSFKRDAHELEPHPVYKPEERRAKVEPVKPVGPVVKHDRMLADQSVAEVNKNQQNNQQISGYEYTPGLEAYPDVAYAPAYGYDPASSRYDMYGNALNPYYVEPDTSTFGLMWSQVPDARTIVSYIGRFVSWTIGSFMLLIFGSVLTVGVCSYTNLCTIAFNVPIREEMRSLMNHNNLEKIGEAASFVKTAIDKYNGEQSLPNIAVRKRRYTLF